MRTLFALSITLVASVSYADDAGKHPSLAVKVIDVSKSKLKDVKLPVRTGVIIMDVTKGGPAADAGVLVGDILVRINDAPINDSDAVKQWLDTTNDGEVYRFTIYRLGAAGKWGRRTVPVKIVYVDFPKVAATPDIAEWKKWEDQQSLIPADQRPFDIKGDRLGMSLEMFKARHHRTVEGDKRTAPFCSDERPGDDNVSLFYKAELRKAGIVHARTTFPFEEIRDSANRPTIAGVPAEAFIYKFVDGSLYDMTVFFEHKDFEQVLEALKGKYGETTVKETRTYQNGFGAKFDGDVLVWRNAVSEISLFERAGKVDDSLLIVVHKELGKLAAEKIKSNIKPRSDDL
jgi:hypothetical protein